MRRRSVDGNDPLTRIPPEDPSVYAEESDDSSSAMSADDAEREGFRVTGGSEANSQAPRSSSAEESEAIDEDVVVVIGGYMRSLMLLERHRGTGIAIRKGAVGGREAYGVQSSIAAMKCMLLRSVTEGRLIRVAEKAETCEELLPPLKRGGNSFGRIYEILYPLTMM
jgi:hypothetical protein